MIFLLKHLSFIDLFKENNLKLIIPLYLKKTVYKIFYYQFFIIGCKGL